MASLVGISEAASIGLHGMMVLASAPSGRAGSGRALSERLQVSANHLAKVMQRLVKGGLLHSVRGPGGGFALAKPASEISLAEIYEAIEGPFAPTGCLLARPICDGRCCIVGGLLQQVDAIVDRLRETTLADAVEGMKGIGNEA